MLVHKTKVVESLFRIANHGEKIMLDIILDDESNPFPLVNAITSHAHHEIMLKST